MICRRIRSYKRYLEALLTLLLIFVIFTTLNFGKGTYGNGAAEKDLPRVSQYRDDVDLPGTGINNSRYYLQARRSYPRIVIYNRVPKCGSSTLRFLIGKLRIKNHFNYEVHNWPNVKQSLTSKEEKELVKQVTLLRRPVLFLRHLHHVNFKKYNLTTFPVYFNMIRHPVDRFISHFYFSRYGFQGWDESKIKTWLWPMPQEQRNMTLEDCVDQGVDKCITQNRENLIAFFCGQESRCRTRDDWSVKQAISNIKRDFAFVGILERLEDSMKIAEALLPRYFSGAAEFLRNHPEGGKKTKTANKKEPTQRVRKLLEQGMKPEMELYSFVKKRFTEQFQILKSKGKIY